MARGGFHRGLIAFVFFATGFWGLAADDLAHGGRTKFEIFGMIDEYLMIFAPFDGRTIERFDPGQSAAAARFGDLLPAYCREEGVSPAFVRNVDADGFTYFISPAIAKSIRSHYAKGGIFGWSGKLLPSEFADASNLDLLRYLRGAYLRYNYKQAEIITAANAPDKVHNLAVALSRLGCKRVRFYIYDAVPTSDVLIFSPTEKIRQFLGIERTVTFDDLNKVFQNGLKLHEQTGSD